MDNINVVNFSEMYKMKSPESVIKAYPEMAWKMIKTLHSELEKVKHQLAIVQKENKTK